MVIRIIAVNYIKASYGNYLIRFKLNAHRVIKTNDKYIKYATARRKIALLGYAFLALITVTVKGFA